MKYEKSCPECGVKQTYSRADHYNHAVKLNRRCRACSNQDLNNCGFKGLHEEMAISWFNKFKSSAASRGYEFHLTPEIIWRLYLQQGKKCNLSGIPIGFSGKAINNTTSIDRIDNSLGYTEENVQLLHVKINMMKHALDQDEFISLCKKVAS
jgi:hypothetical protein